MLRDWQMRLVSFEFGFFWNDESSSIIQWFILNHYTSYVIVWQTNLSNVTDESILDYSPLPKGNFNYRGRNL